jgi:Protein of unknown function (DUF4242)
VTGRHATEYVVECFWPGVEDRDLQALDERVSAVMSELTLAGEEIRYLGSLLLRVDEVVLCLFAGSETAVRTAAERASIPFERILEAARSPWPNTVRP